MVGIVVLGLALAYFVLSPGSGSLVSLGSLGGGFAGSSYSAPGSSQAATPGPSSGSTPSTSSDDSGSGVGSYLGEGIAGLVAVILIYFLWKGGHLGKLASGGSRFLSGVLGRIRRRPPAVRPPIPPVGAPPVSPAVPKKPSWISRLISGSGGKLKVKLEKGKLVSGESAVIDASFVTSGPGVPFPDYLFFDVLSAPPGFLLERNSGTGMLPDKLDPNGKSVELATNAQGRASARFTAGSGTGTAKLIVSVPSSGSVVHKKKLSIKIVPPPKTKVKAAAPAASSAPSPASPAGAGAPKKPLFSWLFPSSGGKFSARSSTGSLFFGQKAVLEAQFVPDPGVPVPRYVFFKLSGPSGVFLNIEGSFKYDEGINSDHTLLKLVPDAQGKVSALLVAGDKKGTAKVRVYTSPVGSNLAVSEETLSVKIYPPEKPKVKPATSPAPAGAPKKPSLFSRLISGSGGKLSVKPARDKLSFGEQTAIDVEFTPGPGVPSPGFVIFGVRDGPDDVSLAKNGAFAPGDSLHERGRLLRLVLYSQGKASALFTAGNEKGTVKITVYVSSAEVNASPKYSKDIFIKILPPVKQKAQVKEPIALIDPSKFSLVLKAEPSKLAFGEVSKISAKPVCKDRSFDLSKIENVAFYIFEELGSVQAPAGISLSSGDTSVSVGPELSAGIVRGTALVLLRAGNEAGNVELRAHYYLPSGEGIEAKGVSVRIIAKKGVSAKDYVTGIVSNAWAGALSIKLEAGHRVLSANDKIVLKATIISKKKDFPASKFGSVCFEIIGDTHGAYIGGESAFRHAGNKISIPVDPDGSAAVYFSSGRDKGRVVVRAFFYKDAYKLEPVFSSKLSIDIREKR